MPIHNRPAFLDLTQIKLNVGEQKSTQKHLNSNFESLQRQIRSEPAIHFKEASHAPDYCAVRQCGFFERYNSFTLSSTAEDVFIHARRAPADCAGSFDGDKFHISVKPEDLPRAFSVLNGLLFSDDSPIDEWKVTDMQSVQLASRVTEGAQFTLYVKPGLANSHYNAPQLHRIRHFVEQLESVLAQSSVCPGQHPDSDIRPSSWQYVSYRNELRSVRQGSDLQNRRLSDEPFYRLMTQ